MIFTRDFVTRENYWQIASLVSQKSLFTVTHAFFFMSCSENNCWLPSYFVHYGGIIMSAMTSQITRCLDYLLNRLFRRRSKKVSKLRATGLFEGNSPVTGERTSSAENVSIWWRHHAKLDATLWVAYNSCIRDELATRGVSMRCITNFKKKILFSDKRCITIFNIKTAF